MLVRRLALGIALATALFGAITLVALEGKGVVVVRTWDENGDPRETRTWIAEENGSLWVEAANPEREFYRDILAGSEVVVVDGDTTANYAASPAENPAGHRRIRRLLRAKYGWADGWIGLLTDTSESIAIRLDPIPAS